MLITMFDFRIVSNVNSVVAIVLGIYILCTGDEMKADAVWFDSKLARMACSIIIGYMIAGAVFIPVEKNDVHDVILEKTTIVVLRQCSVCFYA